MHDVHTPVLTLLVEYLTPWLRGQLWHAPDHVGVLLEEVSLLEFAEIDVGEVSTEIVGLVLHMSPMGLRQIVAVARLTLMMISRNHLRERVLLLESSIHPSCLVARVIKVAVLDVVSDLRGFQVVVAIGGRVSFPVLRNLHLTGRLILFNYQLIEVIFRCPNVVILYHVRWKAPLMCDRREEPLLGHSLFVVASRCEQALTHFIAGLLLIVTSSRIEAFFGTETPLLPQLQLIDNLLQALALILVLPDACTCVVWTTDCHSVILHLFNG